MSLRLSLNDIELITFLGIYKQMKAVDCKMIYKSKGYYFKRLKVLEKEILLSNWNKADYMTEDREHIIFMPFIDTEKLNTLNIFYRDRKDINRKIDILTFRENKEKIKEILGNNTNIITIDQFIDKVTNENVILNNWEIYE